MPFHVTYNFVQGYDNGQKKIVASEMDQNFSDVEGAINTLQTSSVDLTNAQTISGNKTFTGTVDLSGATVISSDNIPVGSIIWSANASVPAGYLLCNGSAVGRATYPELFAAIGTTYGSGDGSTTFNLPNLIDKFIEGANTAGTVKSAGLPNITGQLRFAYGPMYDADTATSALYGSDTNTIDQPQGQQPGNKYEQLNIDASRSSSIYGNSTTVQPPAITAIPCIKAFAAVIGDATVVAGQLVNEIQSKVALDGSNTASIGSTLSTYMAHATMPSGQKIDLTLPANGGTVTAPADGYIVFRRFVTASNQYIQLRGYLSTAQFSAGSTNQLQVFLPVTIGDIVYVNYTAAGNTDKFAFIYANGSYSV